MPGPGNLDSVTFAKCYWEGTQSPPNGRRFEELACPVGQEVEDMGRVRLYKAS